MRDCTIENCDRTYFARGLCQAHYQRLRRGSVITTPVRRYVPRLRSVCVPCRHLTLSPWYLCDICAVVAYDPCAYHGAIESMVAKAKVPLRYIVDEDELQDALKSGEVFACRTT